MIWRAIAISAFSLAAGSAQAQSIVARSGEHDGFSRLVMRLPDGAEWSLNQNGRVANLKINSSSAVFDTSRVFDLIPRDRLQNLTQNGTGQPLRFDLGCDCELSSYVQRDGYLVIDIADGDGTLAQSRQGNAPNIRPATGLSIGDLAMGAPIEPATPPVTSPSGYRFNMTQGAIADARLALDLNSTANAAQRGRVIQQPQLALRPSTQAAVPVEAETEVQDAAETDMAATEPTPVETAEPVEASSRGAAFLTAGLEAELGLNQPQETADPETRDQVLPEDMAEATEVEQGLPDVNLLLDMEESARAATVNASEYRLLQQIGRAANQGLLDVVVTEGEAPVGNRALDPLGRSDRPLDALANISVTSAVDRETGLMAPVIGESSVGDHCLPERRIAIYNWGNDSSFADQLGPLRGALVREFDDINPASVRALAKLYLYFGFGAEARAMLTMLPSGRIDPDQQATLLAMANLLDGEELGINHPFSGQQGCNSDAALWSVLADNNIRKTANTDAIQLGFAKLPVHLRVNFGPQLSSLFAEAGDLHIAEAILRSVDRTGMEYVPELNLAEAAIAELEGDTEVVAEKLTEEVADRTESAPSALVDLIELGYQERKALSP
ncbi:hypothetical protein, partial [Pseudophaeobacter sp.]|uniref:hypothetical protein n=1 Tax=Pseudophaeobacter sp. TaxID=1971739 RepID=UPI0032998338